MDNKKSLKVKIKKLQSELDKLYKKHENVKAKAKDDSSDEILRISGKIDELEEKIEQLKEELETGK